MAETTGPSLHETIVSDARKLAHEINEDVMAGEDEIAAAIEAGFSFRERRLKARIADLERERDEIKRAELRWVRHTRDAWAEHRRLRDDAARLRKASQDAIKMAAEGQMYGNIIAILTAALQPEPGTDPQPARGEDSPVAATLIKFDDSEASGNDWKRGWNAAADQLHALQTELRASSPSPDLVKVREALQKLADEAYGVANLPANVETVRLWEGRLKPAVEAARDALKEIPHV